MALEPTIEEQQQLAETQRRESAGSARRELARELVVCAVFVAAAAALWFLKPPHSVAWGELALCFAITVAAMTVRFQTPLGFTVATQLAFVPLAFAAPPALLAPVVLLALAVQLAPAILRRDMHPSKLLYAPGNCFFAFGPACVFALAGSPRHATAWLLLGALAAQLGTDFAAAGIYLTMSRGVTLREQLAEMSRVWAIDVALSAVALVVAAEALHTPIAVLAVVPLLAVFSMFARERTGRLDKLVELNTTYRGTALLLGDVVEADDAYTGVHSRGVVDLALAVGRRLELDVERMRDLEFAALLHDVGKITIPKEIINKPGTLDPDEWELVKSHAAEGERMLARVGGFMASVGEIVRSHHERWDGGGYPDGLLADTTPLEARIITCCDSWSAMRTDRPYRRAMSHEDAVAEVQRNVGTQFDPRVAQALLAVVDREAGVASHEIPASPTGSLMSSVVDG